VNQFDDALMATGDYAIDEVLKYYKVQRDPVKKK
jgi:hypothetical protein